MGSEGTGETIDRRLVTTRLQKAVLAIFVLVGLWGLARLGIGAKPRAWLDPLVWLVFAFVLLLVVGVVLRWQWAWNLVVALDVLGMALWLVEGHRQSLVGFLLYLIYLLLLISPPMRSYVRAGRVRLAERALQSDRASRRGSGSSG